MAINNDVFEKIEKETEKIEKLLIVEEIQFPHLSLQKEKKKKWWRR